MQIVSGLCACEGFDLHLNAAQTALHLRQNFHGHLVQRNLPRAPSFFVAHAGGRLVGCCALQVYSKRLAEVRSLAVHPDFQDRGLASDLVERCTQRARERGVRELFAVTSQTSFFARLGFATFRREKTAMFLELTPRP